MTSPTKEKAQVGDALGCITDTTANVSGGRVIVPDVDDNETSSVASRCASTLIPEHACAEASNHA